MITIELSGKEGYYSLILKDDGIGLQKNTDDNKVKTLGLSIVEALVNQLDGKLEIINKNGTTFIIEFLTSGTGIK